MSNKKDFIDKIIKGDKKSDKVKAEWLYAIVEGIYLKYISDENVTDINPIT